MHIRHGRTTTIAGEPAADEPGTRRQITRPRAGHDCKLSGCRPHVCKPMAKGTIRGIHAILSGAFEAAMRWDWTDRNPAASAKPPTPSRQTIVATSPEDVAKVIAEARARSAAVGLKLLASYRRTLGHQGHPLEEFRYVHAARKVVGVGSVGTRCCILLLIGRDHDDPLFLQVKEAQASVLEPYAGHSAYPHHGQRVVMGQRLMQAAGDIFLGWRRIKGLDGVTVTTTCGSSMNGRAARTWRTCSCPGPRSTRASAVRPWPGRMPGAATGSRSPPTWVSLMPSTVPSPASLPLTPAGTSVVTSGRSLRR